MYSSFGRTNSSQTNLDLIKSHARSQEQELKRPELLVTSNNWTLCNVVTAHDNSTWDNREDEADAMYERYCRYESLQRDGVRQSKVYGESPVSCHAFHSSFTMELWDMRCNMKTQCSFCFLSQTLSGAFPCGLCFSVNIGLSWRVKIWSSMQQTWRVLVWHLFATFTWRYVLPKPICSRISSPAHCLHAWCCLLH